MHFFLLIILLTLTQSFLTFLSGSHWLVLENETSLHTKSRCQGWVSMTDWWPLWKGAYQGRPLCRLLTSIYIPSSFTPSQLDPLSFRPQLSLFHMTSPRSHTHCISGHTTVTSLDSLGRMLTMGLSGRSLMGARICSKYIFMHQGH